VQQDGKVLSMDMDPPTTHMAADGDQGGGNGASTLTAPERVMADGILVVKWQNGNLFGYSPLITRFHNESGAVVASMNEAGPRMDGIIAYPNPTKGSAVIRIPGGSSQNWTVTITDNAGVVVEQGRSVDERIDLSALPTGVYHCLVKHAGGSLHARIVKQ
jgi:hypothetical protein